MTHTPMFLGTCRVHDAGESMRSARNIPARWSPHRLHTPMQMLQFVRFMAHERLYTRRNVYLLSDYAHASIMEGHATDIDVMRDLWKMRSGWAKYDVFFIEISSLREYFIDRGPAERFYLNTFSKRDVEKYAEEMRRFAASGAIEAVRMEDIQQSNLTKTELQSVMRKIGDILGRRIVWVSHIRPASDDPRFEIVNKVRKHLSDSLCSNAAALRHGFFDPTAVVQEMGRGSFFTKDGEDLDHLSPQGAARLAEVYERIMRGLPRPALPA